MPEYLVQYTTYDSSQVKNKICSAEEVIQLTNEQDINEIDALKVYFIDVRNFGRIQELFYRGWQPNCLIEYENKDHDLMISGFGEDH